MQADDVAGEVVREIDGDPEAARRAAAGVAMHQDCLVAHCILLVAANL
jgi:hypothetical protein